MSTLEKHLSKYEVVIGLEVHAQLSTQSKIFSWSSAAFGGEPNTHTDPICLGMPGTLPVLNQAAVGSAVAEIANKNRFASLASFTSTLLANHRCDAVSKRILGSLNPHPDGTVIPALDQKLESVNVCNRVSDLLKTENRPLINSTT